MQTSRSSPLRYRLLATAAVFAFCTASLLAQNSSPSVNPEVQRLYAEAKSAQAQGDESTAIQKYEAMLKIAPRLGPVYNNLGLLYYGQHDYAHAISVLEAGLKIDPHMSSASALLGTCLFATGQYGKSRAALEAALRGNPHDNQIEILLARALIQLNENREALAHLEALTGRDPKNQEAWYLQGKLYLQLSQQSLGKVAEIDPNSVLAHQISGEIMESMKNYDDALIEFNKAIQIDPAYAGVHEHAGNVYWETGKWDSARNEFLAEIEQNPGDCTARWKAANSLLEEHASPDVALQELNQAIEQCDNLMQARVDRARALIQLGRQSEALPDLTAAEKDSPDEPSIHFLLANVYRAQHDAGKAQQEMKLYADLQQKASSAASRQAEQVESLHPQR